MSLFFCQKSLFAATKLVREDEGRQVIGGHYNHRRRGKRKVAAIILTKKITDKLSSRISGIFLLWLHIDIHTQQDLCIKIHILYILMHPFTVYT